MGQAAQGHTEQEAGSGRAVFVRYWTAAAISSFGSSITTVAMPVLVVNELDASGIELGAVNAAQFVPYAALGLLAGVYTDRWRRIPVLAWSSLGRAAALGAVPTLWLLGVLQAWILVVILLVFGAFSVFGFAATQSLLPNLVPRAGLVRANANLDQTDAAAQTLGPGLGGALVGLLGAPVAIVLDAVSYLVEAALVASLRVREAARPVAQHSLRREIGEGLRWTYRHPTLGPLALSTHVWFLGNGGVMTVLSWLALRDLHVSVIEFSALMVVLGLATLSGALLSERAGRRFTSGRIVIAAACIFPVAWALTIWAALSQHSAVLHPALVLHGIAMGLQNPHEMAYWQLLTPGHLLGRSNGTRRSVNRTAGALGALMAGALIGLWGDIAAMTAMITFYLASALLLLRSPLRTDPSPA